MQAERPRRQGAREAAWAAAAYVALSIALTWPLAKGLARDVPSDFGDPLLNCWILSWDADHLMRGTLGGYWQANIFAPHPWALAYSEHLTAEAIQILPIYATTRNPILCYNLLFLSTFAASGLGMFLFVRELTGSRSAAFVGGLAYAFAPYRFESLPHLQVLSSAWMPFVLFGFRRFFETRRLAPLAGAAAAWLAQNLSCSYYLLFFAPVLAIYLAWELSARRAWRDPRTILPLVVACAAVAAATLPFVIPYIQARQLGFEARSLVETDHFSADVYGYLTASPDLRIWGGLLRAWPTGEGALFPGLTVAALASIAAISLVVSSWRREAGAHSRWPGAERVLLSLIAVLTPTAIAVLFGWSLRLRPFKITRFDRLLLLEAAAALVLAIVSPRARATARRVLTAPAGVFVLMTVFAGAMAFGPHIYARGRLIQETSLYTFFYNHVPGFDGLRVPARFGMLVALGLAVLAADGVSLLRRANTGISRGRLPAIVAGVLIVVESIAVPLPTNANSFDYKQRNLAPLPARITLDEAPPVYGFVNGLPREATLIELPFGEVAFEVRYMFYSIAHWRRLVNGYSGGIPLDYGLLSERLKDLLRRPDQAWDALMSSAATHAVVHEAGYVDGVGARVTDWMRAHGARELGVFGSDRVFELPRR